MKGSKLSAPLSEYRAWLCKIYLMAGTAWVHLQRNPTLHRPQAHHHPTERYRSTRMNGLLLGIELDPYFNSFYAIIIYTAQF